jgi:hypothetical protein
MHSTHHCQKETIQAELLVRYQVLTAASVKVTVFWDIAPCSLVEIDRRFRRTIALMMMEAESISEESVYLYEITRRYIPKAVIFRRNIT